MNLIGNLKMLAGILCGALCTGLTVNASEGDPWIYTWHATIPEHVQKAFLRETGDNLVVDTYTTVEEAEALFAAGASGFDLAIVPADTVARLVANNSIKQLSTLNYSTPRSASTWFEDIFQATFPDIAAYATPFLWGTTGMVVDTQAVQDRLPNAPLDSLDLMFDPENAAALAECGISIVDSAREVVAITLSYLGRDPNSMAKEDLNAAFATLAELMPYAHITDDQLRELENGETCLSLSWSSTGLLPRFHEANLSYDYLVPKEGSLIWADVVVVPAELDHIHHGTELLEFLMSEECAEDIAIYALASRPVDDPSELEAGVRAEVLQLALPDDRRESAFMLSALTGDQKRELDKRWRRLQFGMKSKSH